MITDEVEAKLKNFKEAFDKLCKEHGVKVEVDLMNLNASDDPNVVYNNEQFVDYRAYLDIFVYHEDNPFDDSHCSHSDEKFIAG